MQTISSTTTPIGPSVAQPAKSSKLQSYFLAAAFVLFVLSIVLGIFSGVASGKDQATFKNVGNISNALQFYYSDQDRYPTETQFNDQKILIPFYISAIPKPENAQGVCAGVTDFKYTQQNAGSYKLDFCLVQGTAGLSKGMHTLTEKTLQ
ncbi:MAG: hypothetical protein JWO40_280 [Candidatus Doudnabacteria bacterium]|nr:hypothetical protein [Candidatus Doudnabacteria bacterium]